MIFASLALVGGILLAALGGEAFLKGVLAVSRWWRIPPSITAATLGAFATSSPEVFVSAMAAWDGQPAIGFGDATGSNVVNIALILALALLLKPMPVSRRAIALDFVSASAACLLLGTMIWDGLISRFEALVLLIVFLAWMGMHVRTALRVRSEPSDLGGSSEGWRAAAWCLVGLVTLVLAGMLVVDGATVIATAYGVPPFLIGATLVALGTSMPELATTLTAVRRGHHEVGVGTLLGSNVFNGLFIVAITAAIHPIEVSGLGPWIALLAALIAVALTWPGRASAWLGHSRGLLLIAVYGVYITLLAVTSGMN